MIPTASSLKISSRRPRQRFEGHAPVSLTIKVLLWSLTASLTLSSCKSTNSKPNSAIKDFDQIQVLTPSQAICKDGSVYQVAKVAEQTYSVTPPAGGAVTVNESELLKTVCPQPGAGFSGNALEAGRYGSVTGEAGQLSRCDMTFLPLYNNGLLVGANASAAALESDTAADCNDAALVVYAFSCSGTGDGMACTAASHNSGAITLTQIARYSFVRTITGKAHTYVNIQAPPAPSGAAPAIIKSGIYSSPPSCALKVSTFYNGPQLSHLLAERQPSDSCGPDSLGRDAYACTYGSGVPSCKSVHGENVRIIDGFTTNAFRIKFSNGQLGTYSYAGNGG